MTGRTRRDGGESGRRLAALLAAGILAVAGCGASAPAVPPGAPSPVPSTTASPVPTGSPSAVPTPSPRPTRGPTPVPTLNLPPAGHWSRVDDQPAWAHILLRAMTAGPDGYVAVGTTVLSRSSDGTAVGGTAAWSSVDGVTWIQADLPPVMGGFGLVVYDRLGYLASGLEPIGNQYLTMIWLSRDGHTWRRAPDLSSFTNSLVYGIARFGSHLFAVGVADLDQRSRLAVWTSDDGLAWEPVDGIRRIDSQGIGDVVTFRGLLVATNGGQVLTSRDGRTWAPRTLPSADRRFPGWAEDLLVDGDRLIAVGARGCPDPGSGGCWIAAAWTSIDGTTWRPALLDAEEDSLRYWALSSVVRSGDRLIAIGPEGTYFDVGGVWESADGRLWARSATLPTDGPYGCSTLAAAGPWTWCLGDTAWILRQGTTP